MQNSANDCGVLHFLLSDGREGASGYESAKVEWILLYDIKNGLYDNNRSLYDNIIRLYGNKSPLYEDNPIYYPKTGGAAAPPKAVRPGGLRPFSFSSESRLKMDSLDTKAKP